MKRLFFAATTCAMLACAPASAQGLSDLLGQLQGGETSGGDLLGQLQNGAKASAFDAIIGSQVPALAGLTQNLTAEQKARLFDLGANNTGTLGTLATGAAALGGMVPQAGVQPAQPTYGAAQPAPTYIPQPSPYGTVQPTYPQPAPAYEPQQPAYGTAQPTYTYPQPTYQPEQPVYGTVQPSYQPQRPVYGTAQPTYQPQQPNYAPPVPATSQQQGTSNEDLIGNLIQMGIGALGN